MAKPAVPWSSSAPPGCCREILGYTLIEMLVSVAIFLMVIGVVLSSHLYGLRLMELSKNGIEASDGYLRQCGILYADLGSARKIVVGRGGRDYFTAAPTGAPLQGNALQAYPTLETNRFIRYYLDAADQTLKRLDETAGLSFLAQNVTNNVVFALEDCAGLSLTNQSAHAVAVIRLEFSALSGTSVRFGPGNYYSAYHRQFKVASRAIE